MTENNTSQFVIYQNEDGQIKLDVRFVDETVWLTQSLMAQLFSTTPENVLMHLKNIFAEQELNDKSVVKDFFTTASDGKKYRTGRNTTNWMPLLQDAVTKNYLTGQQTPR